MADPEMLYGTTVSVESIKVIAESIGVGALPDDAAKELADDVSFKLKQIVQDAAKFMHHAKRAKLSLHDVDHALKIRKIEPQYGFVSSDSIPFRFASGGGRELHFIEEKELDLTDIIQAPPPKVPLDVTLRTHWLCVDGVQPTVPENPPPLSKDMQALDSVNPIKKLEKVTAKDMSGKPTTGKAHKLKNVETVQVKQLATHELSVEQQLYYKEITEACVESDEARRAEALQSLAADPGLHEMLPRMCTFIAEGVKVNVVLNNLALLIYLMRMVKAMLDNSSLYLEKYLHELIPSIMTCIVSRQLCNRPELDNHWALRDFAARLMAQICKNFNTSTNNLQARVTRLFSHALQNDKAHLSSLYGSLAGLSELGTEVIKVFIIPRLKFIVDRIESDLMSVNASTDKTAAGYIRTLLQKVCPPVLKTIRSPPDVIEEYKRDFGYFGITLHQAVVKIRQGAPANASSVGISSSSSLGSAATQSAMSGGLIKGGSGPTITIGSTPLSTKNTNIGIQRPIIQTLSNPSTPSGASPLPSSGQPKFKYVTQAGAAAIAQAGGTVQIKYQSVPGTSSTTTQPKTVFVREDSTTPMDFDDLAHLQ